MRVAGPAVRYRGRGLLDRLRLSVSFAHFVRSETGSPEN